MPTVAIARSDHIKAPRDAVQCTTKWTQLHHGPADVSTVSVARGAPVGVAGDGAVCVASGGSGVVAASGVRGTAVLPGTAGVNDASAVITTSTVSGKMPSRRMPGGSTTVGRTT
jgi:hypothetical protein